MAPPLVRRGLLSLVLLTALLCLGAASVAAATFTVNSTNDVDDTVCDGGHCSLREAILAANASGGADSIVFSVTGTISTVGFPAITEQVDLDGNSAGIVLESSTGGLILDVASGASAVIVRGVTLRNGNAGAFTASLLMVQGSATVIGGPDSSDRVIFLNGGPKGNSFVELKGNGATLDNVYFGLGADGTTLSGAQHGLVLNGVSGTTIIKNSVFTDASACGINLQSTSGTIEITANKIGVKADGVTAGANNEGICDMSHTSSATITIGGVDSSARNIITGNTTDGIGLRASYNGSVTIRNNYIGLTSAGNSLGNGNGIGVKLISACGTAGNCKLQSNVISGNSQQGVKFDSGAQRWQMVSNTVGLNTAGTAAIANGTGVLVTGTANTNYIGNIDNSNANPNFISGNTNSGILIQDFASGSSVKISSNYIGTNSSGQNAVPNGQNGIRIEGGGGTVDIGDSTANNPRNVISGNTAEGILATSSLVGDFSGRLRIYSSTIGLNVDQNSDLGNGGTGIDIHANTPALEIVIGNTRTQGFNIIAGNAGHGVWTDGVVTGNVETISGNFIGTSSAATTAYKNDLSGIYVNFTSGQSGPMIGGDSVGAGNVVFGHTTSGEQNNEQIFISPDVDGTKIFGNFIGVDANGNIRGGSKGIMVKGKNTSVGSNLAGGGNTIGGLDGFALSFSGASEAKVKNNTIGITSTNVTTGGQGIFVDSGSTYISIGGDLAGERNFISNLTGDGITINGASSNIVVFGNYIGLDTSGNVDKGNTGDGIEISNASNIYIGRNIAGDVIKGNVISGNAGHGINLTGSLSLSSVYIEGNTIGLNAANANSLKNDLDGVNVSRADSNVFVGGDLKGNIISGNGDQGIDLNNSVTGVKIQKNYIGLTTNGANVSTVGNTNGGIKMQNGAYNNVVGYAYGATIPTDFTTSNGNWLGYNGVADVILDGNSVVGNSLRGNFFDHSNADTSVNISFANGANHSVTTNASSISTSDTSRVKGTTNLDNSVNLDVYYVRSGNTPSMRYEGTATVSNGGFQLDKDFAAVAGDRYFIQVTESDGDSTDVSLTAAVVADTTVPAAPTLTSSLITNDPTYTFEGTKEAYSGISLNGGVSSQVPVDSLTTWSFTDETPLDEGANSVNLVARDYSGNQTENQALTVTLDTIAPAAPTITSASSVSGLTSTYTFAISGTKEAGASVTYGGSTVVQANDSTTFSFNVTLNQGNNTISNVRQNDAAGNQSSAVVDFTVTYVQVAPAGGGGGGSGGGGGGSSSGSTSQTPSTTQEEEEEETPPSVTENEEVAEETSPEESNTSQAGESENTEDQQGVSSSGEPDSSEGESVEASSGVGEEEQVEETVAQEADIDSSTGTAQAEPDEAFLEELEALYPTAEDQVFSDENDDGVNDNFYPPVREVLMPPHPRIPIWKPLIHRETLLQNPFYTVHFYDRNDNKIPDWWEKKFFTAGATTPTVDTDKDGITDGEEFEQNTDPTSTDSDGDGVSDGVEAQVDTDPNGWDSDEDGLSDLQEVTLGTDPISPDTDADGVTDSVELEWGGDPWDAETVPVSTIAGGGVPDAWLKTYNLEETYAEEIEYVLAIGQNVQKTVQSWDTDADGLSDYDELIYGSNPLEVDSDGDGASDGDEVHTYKTNPSLLTPSSDFFRLKIANLVSHFKSTYFDDQPVFLGSATPETKVQWTLVPMEAELAKSFLFPRFSLYADLFNADTSEELSGSVEVDESGKFLIRPSTSIQTGDYALVVQTVDAEGNIVEETLSYDVKVDGETVADWVDPKQLDEFPIDLDGLELIRLENQQPYLYGVAGAGYEVVAAWQSELYTSSLVVDTTEGEFVTAAPSALEQGLHDLYVYAYDPEKNYYSSVINIDFEVLTGGLYSSAGGGESLKLIVLALFGLIGVVSLGGLVLSRHRKHHSVSSAAEGLDPKLKPLH